MGYFPFICVSSNSYNFQHTDVSVTLLNLFLSVFLFLMLLYCFFISFSDNLLLVYRSTPDFCILQLPEFVDSFQQVLWILFYVFCFLLYVCGVHRIFSIYDHGFCKQRQFYFFLFNLHSFLFLFSCLIGLARTVRTMLNMSGDGGILVLLLILEAKI